MNIAQIFPFLKTSARSGRAKQPTLKGAFRVEIYNQLATFIEDGFTPFKAATILAVEYGDSPKDRRGKFYRYLTKRLTQGESMASALRGTVPQTDLYVLEAAEEIGSLGEGFRRLIYFSEKSAQLTGNLFSLFKPLGLVFAATGILYGFASAVLPDFATMVPPSEWGGATISLMETGDFLENWALIIFGVIGIYFVISSALLPSYSSPFRDKVLKRYLPPWNFYQLFVANSFLLTLGTMMQSGIRLKDALPMVKAFSGTYLKDHIEQMEASLQGGLKEGRAIATDLFDVENQRLLRIYGQSDQFESKMQVIAQRSLEYSIKRVEKIVGTANVVMRIAIAFIIIWIVMAIGGVVLPMIEQSI